MRDKLAYGGGGRISQIDDKGGVHVGIEVGFDTRSSGVVNKG